MSAALTDTIGKETVPDHIPDCTGFPGLELEKVTEIGSAVAVLFEKSQADTTSE
jgi:hypothetical protein